MKSKIKECKRKVPGRIRARDNRINGNGRGDTRLGTARIHVINVPLNKYKINISAHSRKYLTFRTAMIDLWLAKRKRTRLEK